MPDTPDPSAPDLLTLLPAVVDIARRAGAAILPIYESADHGVQTKDDDSPLTRADLASHRLIVDALRTLTPDIPVLSEESPQAVRDQRRQWPRFWLVDPLDGTKEFVRRNGEFTVNIALIEGHQAVLGVVHSPVLALDYYAAAGAGAWKRKGTEPAHRIEVRRRAEGPLAVVGSRSHGTEALSRFLHSVGAHELVSMGSSLKLCLVAEGAADLYPRLGPTSEWDTAAAQCVVEQAGGQVTDTGFQRLLYNAKDDILNPQFLVFGDPQADWTAYFR